MKILLVHNNYGRYSGEETVVDKMARMLCEHGHEVCFYRLTTEGSRETVQGKIRGFLCGAYSPSGIRGLYKALEQEKPDLVNVHNLYPFISPAALFECKKAGIPVVMTVHNFRLICPTGLFMRNGKPCEKCLQKGSEWSCIRYNCEHSYLRSVGYTLRNVYARWTGAYRKNVDVFACITGFQKKKLIEAGFDKNKIVVIPNSIDVPLIECEIMRGDYVAYIGRLSYEKGYDQLVEVAHRHPEIQFCFAGAKREDSNVTFPDNVHLMGYLKGEDLNLFIKQARFVVIPSRCYEGFPMSILEAARFHKCAIAPDHGGFTEIIGKEDKAIGYLFEPNNVCDLEKQIAVLWSNPDQASDLGKKAFEKLRQEYSSEVVYEKWSNLFTKLFN